MKTFPASSGRLGSNTWPIVRDLVDDVVPVTEAEIVKAMQLCYERMKVGRLSITAEVLATKDRR